MKCTDCKYCLQWDFGYSNYTVEGAEVHCLIDLNPGLPSDRWYGEEPALEYANKCLFFVDGHGVHVDVEKEEGDMVNYTDDPVIKEMIKFWMED